MKTTDYFPIGKCPVCGKLILSPTTWLSKKTARPAYATCSHYSIIEGKLGHSLANVKG